MRQLFNGEYGAYNNFFNDRLEPLFYKTLAVKRRDDYSNEFNCKIPFLNGGLFEPLNDCGRVNKGVFKNEIFKDVFDTFDEFNFTVKEDEPLEKEVAVDPEMLGKVFENLLEVSDRKSKGAFYTPREIVHYMCQQSLVNYLETNTGLGKKDIEKFIQSGDLILDRTIKARTHKKKFEEVTDVNSNYMIPKSIENNYELIDTLLKEIKIVDPAVGSGAFPMGMMNEIVKARSILSIFFDGDRSIYELKRECVEKCLYGVDIMPSAVDICRLRFWLSLIVDETDKVKPLPNLDDTIKCGNSLLEEFEGIQLFDESLLGKEAKDIKPELNKLNKEIGECNLKIKEIATGKIKGDIKRLGKEIKRLKKKKNELEKKPKPNERNLTISEIGEGTIKESKKKVNRIKRLQKEFFSEYDGDKKRKLRKEIDQLEWELIETTLKESGNEESLEKLEKIKKSKSKPFFLWKLHFAEIFQKENPGFDIVIANPPYFPITKLSEDVKDTLFNNNPEITGSFAGKTDVYLFFILKSLKKLTKKNGHLSYIIPKTLLSNMSFSRLRQVLITSYEIKGIVDLDKVFESVTGTMTYLLVFIKNKKPNKEYNLAINIMECGGHIDPSMISIKNLDRPPNYIWVLSESKLKIINKIEENTDLLKKDYLTKNGICTGSNSKFITTKKVNSEYKPIIVAKNISKHHLKKSEYFINFKPNLLHRPRESGIFKSPKIVSQMIRGLNTTYRLICALDYSDERALNNVNIIRKKQETSDLEFLQGLITSKLINFYFKNLITDVNIKTVYLDLIPIKKSNTNIKTKIREIVNKIIFITKDGAYSDDSEKKRKVNRFEKEIDELVYELYNLTPEEIKVIEKFHK